VSSTNVSAASAAAPTQWQPSSTATQDSNQDNGSSPFAALLDAAASAPTTAPQTAPAAAPQPKSAFAGHRNTGTTGGDQNTTQGATAPVETKTANAPGQPGTTADSAANPATAQNNNVPASQPGTAAQTGDSTDDATLIAFASQLAKPVSDAAATAPTPGSTAKTSDKTDQDDSAIDDSSDTSAATNNQTQPVAAAIAANTAISATPADSTGSDATIDGAANASANSSAKAAASAIAAKTAAQDFKDAAQAQGADEGSSTEAGKGAAPAPNTKAPATKPTTVANGTTASATSTTDTASPSNANDNQPANGTTQGQARADNDSVVLAQNGGSAAAHSNVASDAGNGTNTQSGANAAKATTDGIANFTIAAAGQTAPPSATAAAASSSAVTAAAVPIAGLPIAIAARAQSGSNQFDIRLDPPELGRIDVSLNVDSNGQVTSHIVVDRADTLQLLQNQQPQLQHALEQAGLTTADNGLQFSLRDQSFTGQNGQNGAGNQPGAAQLVIPDASQPAVATTQIYSRIGRLSGIDIRV
jgi:flagellar hook-length control protein FliK